MNLRLNLTPVDEIVRQRPAASQNPDQPFKILNIGHSGVGNEGIEFLPLQTVGPLKPSPQTMNHIGKAIDVAGKKQCRAAASDRLQLFQHFAEQIFVIKIKIMDSRHQRQPVAGEERHEFTLQCGDQLLIQRSVGKQQPDEMIGE
ncbi:hypothetical protein SDC9_103986 [bioreactor metagenome]|uniref:Uncharacterized protein n=1 Tax=bioreactor metagenome TaxID=1076179 RepID=A0A645AV84_9ZZZZ